MPGSLLNLGRSRLTRHDSTRSDISTYSNDSKKRVSFNKAVRVKKYTRSEDGNDPRRSGRKFWFKVYEDELDPDRWEEYSGDEGKGYSDDRLKTIDESSSVHNVEADSTENNEVKKIIEKFNQQSIGRQEHAGAKYDSLTKYKKNSILNGMKSFFGSASFRNKKKNNSVQDRNLENLFRSHNEENIPNGDLRMEKSTDDLWTPKVPEKFSYSKLELDNQANARENKPVVEVEKWESGDKLVFDARQFDKSVEKTDDGELTKTVEQGDKVWKNITRTITYAESSPKIVRKPKERTNGSRSDATKAIMNTERTIDRVRSSNKSLVKRDTATQCTQVPETKSKNSDKYKVIRSRNGMVSAYSDVPLLDDDKIKTNKRTALNIDRINRPTTCKRDHQRNDIKREISSSPKSKLHHHTDNMKKNIGDYSPSVMSREASHRRTEPKLSLRSTADYRRGYSTLSTNRRGSRNRARSHDDRIPNISGVKILVNGESVDEGSVRGGLAAAYKTRQRERTSSTSPVREFKSYVPSSDTNSAYNHETVVLYIPGISHQEKRAEEEERISGGAVTRSQSMLAKRPSNHKKYDSMRDGLQCEKFDEDDEMEPLMENKEISPIDKKQQRTVYRTLARV